MERVGTRVVLPIVLAAVLSLIISISILGAFSISLLSQRVGPALEANAIVIGDRVRARIESAVALGIPYDRMVGVEPYLRNALAGSPGVASLTLLDTASHQLYFAEIPHGIGGAAGLQAGRDADRSDRVLRLIDRLGSLVPLKPPASTVQAPGEVTLPLTHDGAEFGQVRVGIDHLYITRQLLETAIDIAVMTGVAVLIAAEALILITSTAIRGPLSQLGRIMTRLSGRNYERKVVPVGSQLSRQAIAAANSLVQAANDAAAAIRERISGHRSGSAGHPDNVIVQAEDRLARIGRFAQDGRPSPLAATQLVGVRGAAFLFVLAEELTRPFLPLYIGTVTAGNVGADPALLIAVPISAFMLGLALAGPFAASWSDRAGRRTTFIIGALLSTMGLIWTAHAGGLGDLVLSRGLSGLGYALTFVACQGQVIDRTDDRTRTWGMSIFVGGIMAADVCGPAIGGILAEQIGYAGALSVAAAVALLAALMATILLDNDTRHHPVGPALGWRTTLRCLANPRFVAVLLLAAVPAKLVLTGFLFFLVPLVMLDLGASDSEIGRVTMLYGIAAIALMPVFARLCDRFQSHGAMVGLGGLIAGWAIIPLAFGPTQTLVALAVLGFGAGQAMSIPAQSVLVTFLSRREIAEFGPGRVLGVFRLAERLGAVLGPLAAAQMLRSHEVGEAAAVFGFLAVTLATVFSTLFLTVGTQGATVGPAPAFGDDL